MKKQKTSRWQFALVGACALSFAVSATASIPQNGTVTDDSALYQNLSEIQAKRAQELNYDGDLRQLAKLQKRYHEKLPSLSKRPSKPVAARRAAPPRVMAKKPAVKAPAKKMAITPSRRG